jgi:hypothetical protein
MSAYLISTKQASVIAKSLYHYSKELADEINLDYVFNGYHEQMGSWLSLDSENWQEKLFSLLMSTNELSLSERYNDKAKNDFKYDEKAPIVSIPCLIDLISNWSYQSCEGVAEETDFYKLMMKVQGKIAIYYAKQGRETLWGIDDYSDIDNVDLITPVDSVSLLDLCRKGN